MRDEIRDKYAAAARAVEGAEQASCCGPDCCDATAEPGFGRTLYDAVQRDEVPDAAALASLGCGNPTAVAELREGETVLDLGSGGGIDVILSARRVGPTGTAYGLDMTDEMLALAQRNAAEAQTTNVHFLKGTIEDVPLPAGSVDVVISNCVINLSTDKPAVLAEIARVLKPGGRVGIADIVADDTLDQGRAPSAEAGSAASPALSRSANTEPGWRPQVSWTSRSPSRTPSPTGCTARSCAPASRRRRP